MFIFNKNIRKRSIKILILLSIMVCLFHMMTVNANYAIHINQNNKEFQHLLDVKYEYSPPAYVLYDMDSDDFIITHNEDKMMGIASLSKIMTALLLCEAIENETASYDDMVTISEFASSKDGDVAKLHTGDIVSIYDLIHSCMICSSNDAATAIAEYLADTEEEFAHKMNDKLQELDLDGYFTNASGLTNYDNDKNTLEVQNIMSAEGIAKLSTYILTNYPNIINITSLPKYTISYNNHNIINTNKLLGHMEGVFGLKTGFTNFAGWCQSTAQSVDVNYRFSHFCLQDKNLEKLSSLLPKKHRLISVVLGAKSSRDRKNISKDLLNYVNQLNLNVFAIKGIQFYPKMLGISNIPKNIKIYAGEHSIKWIPYDAEINYHFIYDADWKNRKELFKLNVYANYDNNLNEHTIDTVKIGTLYFYSNNTIYSSIPVVAEIMEEGE